MTYVITGTHDGVYFPSVLGTYARGVSKEMVATIISQAEEEGWSDLIATIEAF